MTIYEQMKAAGVQIDNHESDLYVPVNAATMQILDGYEHIQNVTTFIAQGTDEKWYDIPFAYDPFWDRVKAMACRP